MYVSIIHCFLKKNSPTQYGNLSNLPYFNQYYVSKIHPGYCLQQSFINFSLLFNIPLHAYFTILYSHFLADICIPIFATKTSTSRVFL